MSITIQPTETVPFIYGDDGSLHCVIASNGYVWGKCLDGESGRKDVELAIYAPVNNGYIWRKANMSGLWCDVKNETVLRDCLTQTQRAKIEIIMSQQSTLTKLLGCIHLHPTTPFIGNYWREKNFNRALRFTDLPYWSVVGGFAQLIDCSFAGQSDDKSYYSFFKISYDDIACAFLLRADEHALAFRSSEELSELAANAPTISRRCAEIATSQGKPLQFEFCAAQANRKAFDFHGTTLCKKGYIPRMRYVLYKGYNIFDFFAIDDALLLAETHTTEDGQMTIAWTVAIAQNQHVRHMRRLSLNNPDLLVRA